MEHEPGGPDLPAGHDLSGTDHAGIEPHPAIHATPPGGLELDTPDGPHALDAPTVDSDADGIADTTLTTDPAIGPGALGLATDLDGDGHVDVLTTVDAAGTARTVAFPTDGAPSWDEGTPPPPPVLDPASGRWTRLAD